MTRFYKNIWSWVKTVDYLKILLSLQKKGHEALSYNSLSVLQL